MSEPHPIDADALDALLDTTGGDPAFLGELIDTFLADAPELLDAMDVALAGDRPDDVRRAAHSLKSTSATFGALTLSAVSREIEERANTGALDGLPASVAAARAEFARVRTVLRSTRAEL